MNRPGVVSAAEWQAAREELLVKEKELTRQRDELAAERRRLPMVRVEKDYVFEGPEGEASLLDLFDGRRQLIVYRFFFEPGVARWPEAGCEGCSMFADNIGHLAHLNARDTTLVLVSPASQADIERLKERMGWEIPWFTTTDDFSEDFDVPQYFGLNVFLRDGEEILRTYFTNGRAAEAIGPVWSFLDLTWPLTHATAVIEAWQARAPTAPDELAASLLITASGDVEKPPVTNVFGAMLGTESDAAEQFDELVVRVGADPASAFHKQMSYRETKRYLAELGDAMSGEDDRLGEDSDDEPQGHPYSKSEFFRRPLPKAAIAALVDNFVEGGLSSQSRELDFTPWGGAYNRVPAEATAFVHRDELFLLQHAVVADPDASTTEREDARRWLTRSWGLVHGWGSGGVYPNWPDPDLEDWDDAYYRTNYERLVRVKRKYDLDDFFHFHQSLPSRALESGAPA